VGRTYAGVLGFTAFATEVARGLVHAAGVEATFARACGGLLAFTVIGAVVGWLAERVVAQSVVERVSDELAASEQTKAPSGASR
jgi:biotin transporter BioY